MLDFVVDELVWATMRQREDEARQARPHTDPRPDAERPSFPPTHWANWFARSIGPGTRPQAGCTR